ncbi:MAG: ankyrin repeat domain-containing protein, partial [Brevinemataceae bacterium]
MRFIFQIAIIFITILNFKINTHADDRLIEIINRNNVKEFEIYITNIQQINFRDPNGSTYLMMAIAVNNDYFVKELLKKNININIANRFGWNALMIASFNGNKKIVSMLLNSKKIENINHKNEDGCSALTIAARNGHKNIVDLLQKFGADINSTSTEGKSGFLLAIQNGYLDTAKFFYNNKYKSVYAIVKPKAEKKSTPKEDKTKVKDKAKSNTKQQPNAKDKAKSNTKQQPNAKDKAKSNTKQQPNAKNKAKPNAQQQPNAKNKAKPNAQQQPNTKNKAKPNAQQQPNTKNKAKPNSTTPKNIKKIASIQNNINNQQLAFLDIEIKTQNAAKSGVQRSATPNTKTKAPIQKKQAPSPNNKAKQANPKKETKKVNNKKPSKEQNSKKKEANKERTAKEKEADKERAAKKKEAEKERVAKEKEAEKERVTKEKEAEKERVAKEKEAEKERVAKEKEAEKERVAKEKEAEKERVAKEKEAEKERVAKEKEEQRIAKEKAKQQKALEMINYIDKSADVNGITILLYAVNSENDKITKYILSKPNNTLITAKEKIFGCTALLFAAANTNLTILKQLFKAGADVNEPNNSGTTPLMLAARCGHFDNVKYLASKGANFFAKDKKNADIVQYAIEGNNEKILKYVKNRQKKLISTGKGPNSNPIPVKQTTKPNTQKKPNTTTQTAKPNTQKKPNTTTQTAKPNTQKKPNTT